MCVWEGEGCILEMSEQGIESLTGRWSERQAEKGQLNLYFRERKEKTNRRIISLFKISFQFSLLSSYENCLLNIHFSLVPCSGAYHPKHPEMVYTSGSRTQC